MVEQGMWGKLLNHNLPTAGLLSAPSFVCLFSLFFGDLFVVFGDFFWSVLTPTFDIFPCSIKVVNYRCKFGAIIRINSLTRLARWDFRRFDEKVSKLQ